MDSLLNKNHKRKVVSHNLSFTHYFIWHLLYNHIFSSLTFSNLCYIDDFNLNCFWRIILKYKLLFIQHNYSL